jgi:hypothetical protein
VLHRDIKPSNILMTAYGHPVLSDFGIAASLSESEPQEVVGMSIPWSAPEVLLDETAGTVESEVWSLGATVYSLLAGRSPFEILGSDKNGASELIGRIDKAKLVPTGRTDVPPSLERILARSMSRRPEQRQSSVLELLRELQQVESEVGVGQTPIEVAVDDWALATVTDLEEKTRIRGVAPVAATRRRRRRRRQVTEAPAVHGPRAGAGARGQAGPGQSRALLRSTGTRPARRDRRVLALVWLLVAAGVVVIALGATATLVLVRATSTEIPRVTGISTSSDGTSVVFSWSDPGLRPGDSYVITTGDDSSQRPSVASWRAPPTPTPRSA